MFMKKTWILGIVVLSLTIFIVLTLLVYPTPDNLTDKIYVGAHRGNAKQYMENTLPAFESALQMENFSFIEFDILYTKDKRIVVHHDYSLLRLQKKLYWIHDLTYDELMNLSDYHIPTYEEVMDLVGGKKPVDIEIKSDGNLTEDMEMVDYVMSDLARRGIVNTTMISSLSFDLIEKINIKYNNLSDYYQYIEFWIPPRFIDTGLIFFVDESTFTRKIPVIRDLTEKFRDNGVFESMLTKMYLSGANYLLIHGANIDQYNALRSEIPLNSKIMLWTLADNLHLMLPDQDIWDGVREANKIEARPVLPWWEE
jgi:glycerophosphoryl diester phosphodiesterase